MAVSQAQVSAADGDANELFVSHLSSWEPRADSTQIVEFKFKFQFKPKWNCEQLCVKCPHVIIKCN